MDTKSLFNISDKAYDILKWVAILGCGILTELLTNIFDAIGIPDNITLMIVRIISALAIALGAFLGVSESQYAKTNGNTVVSETSATTVTTEDGEEH